LFPIKKDVIRSKQRRNRRAGSEELEAGVGVERDIAELVGVQPLEDLASLGVHHKAWACAMLEQVTYVVC
jgi:hypothetical protein